MSTRATEILNVDGLGTAYPSKKGKYTVFKIKDFEGEVSYTTSPDIERGDKIIKKFKASSSEADREARK